MNLEHFNHSVKKLYPLYSLPICPEAPCCAVLICSVRSNSLQPRGLQATRLLYPWEFSRQEYQSGLPCPPPRDLPNPGIKPRSPALQADSLPAELPGKPICSPKQPLIQFLSLQIFIFWTFHINEILHYLVIICGFTH